MYATDRRHTKASLNASALWGRMDNNTVTVIKFRKSAQDTGRGRSVEVQ